MIRSGPARGGEERGVEVQWGIDVVDGGQVVGVGVLEGEGAGGGGVEDAG